MVSLGWALQGLVGGGVRHFLQPWCAWYQCPQRWMFKGCYFAVIWTYLMKYRVMYGLPWITIFCHEWGDSAMISFFTCHLMPWNTTDQIKAPINQSFCLCPQGQFFLICHFDITTGDLWHQANMRCCYCDVIFVNYSCTHKLEQSWSSPVNDPVFTV